MPGIAQSLLLAIVVTVTPPKKAADGQTVEGVQRFRGDYTVSYLGLPLARSSFTTMVKDSGYSIEGSLSSAGLAEIFDDTNGSLAANGRFGGQATRPASYKVSYKTGGKAKSTRVSFAGGNVTEAVNLPKNKRKLVALTAAHLKNVTDPISATLVPAPSLAAVCDRTLRIFDGELRADLRLSRVSSGPVSIGGYEGETVTCAARFIPLGGYRKGQRAIEYMRDKSSIEVTFAPLGESGLYAPIRATVGTQIGSISITADRFEAVE